MLCPSHALSLALWSLSGMTNLTVWKRRVFCWHNLWLQAGRPASGTLQRIKSSWDLNIDQQFVTPIVRLSEHMTTKSASTGLLKNQQNFGRLDIKSLVRKLMPMLYCLAVVQTKTLQSSSPLILRLYIIHPVTTRPLSRNFCVSVKSTFWIMI